MNSFKVGLSVTIAWVVTILIAYAVGWWQGVERAAHAATSVASSSAPLIVGALVIVAIVSAVLAFRVRGFFSERPPT